MRTSIVCRRIMTSTLIWRSKGICDLWYHLWNPLVVWNMGWWAIMYIDWMYSSKIVSQISDDGCLHYGSSVPSHAIMLHVPPTFLPQVRFRGSRPKDGSRIYGRWPCLLMLSIRFILSLCPRGLLSGCIYAKSELAESSPDPLRALCGWIDITVKSVRDLSI